MFYSVSRSVLFFIALSGICTAREARVTILATTDLHGHVYPWDYLAGREAQRGLAKIATLIAAERATSPSALLVDAGDTIQGATMEGVWQTWVSTGKLPNGVRFDGPDAPQTNPPVDPMMLTMNALRYDAMALGNHELNFGFRSLNAARESAKFPWLSANTKVAPGSKAKPFEPWLLKDVDGVKVAIIGLTTPTIPLWEKPENIVGMTFSDPVQAAREAVAELRAKHHPDLIIAVAHTGLDRDLATGAPRNADTPGENRAYQIATEVEGIDAVIFGHTHQELPEGRANGVLLTQPKNWGMSLARLDFTLESKPGGKGWTKKSSASRTIPVIAATTPDPKILALARPYHDVAERWLNTPVAEATQDLSAATARIQDTALIDAIHEVQLHYAKADVSLAAAFNTGARVPKGPVTIRQLASLYVYDNELYAIEGTGRMLREALENGARYYRSCPDAQCAGPLINTGFPGFNYDMAGGVTYEVDLTQPPGSRIRNLRFGGKPLDDSQTLRIALNNYRAGGSGGYEMFRGAKVLWQSHEEIRELMIRYYSSHPLPVRPDDNWKVVPEAAREQLRRDLAGGVGRPANQ